MSLTTRTLFQPPTLTFAYVADSAANVYESLAHAGELSAENRRLKAIESAALLYTEQEKRYEGEIGRLRALLELPETPGKSRVPAIVTGYSPLGGPSTLSVGSNQGVRRGMPVVSGEGLYGVIQTVDPNFSQALLISSPQLRLVGVVHRDPQPAGLIRGQSSQALLLEVYDAKAVPQNGDMVFTSGFSERIPAGIPIGKIVQLNADEASGSLWCKVFPNVQVGAVREVLILK